MFARVVEFSPTSETASQLVRVIEETALRMVKAQAGCVAAFVEVRGQVVVGVSVWESTADAARYSQECYPEIKTMLRPFLKCDPELHTFKVREIGSVVVRARGYGTEYIGFAGASRRVAIRLTFQPTLSDGIQSLPAGRVIRP
jgi:hypothetical protein